MKSIVFRLLVLLVLLVLPILVRPCFAQVPVCLHYDINDGLPSALAYCIKQDHQGFIWVGTDKGLARFDGSRFRTYNIKDGLPDNEILNLYEDKNDRLWVSCFRNKPCYLKDGVIYTAQNDSMLQRLTLNSGTYTFEEAADGNMWIAGFSKEFCKIKGDKVTCIKPDFVFGSTRLIKAIKEKIFCFDGRSIAEISEDGKLKSFFKNTQKGITYERLYSIGISGNRVLYSYLESLILFEHDGVGFRKIAEQVSGPVGSVFTDNSGRFWLATQSEGAVCYDHIKDGLSKPVKYLTDEKISSVFEDKEGSFWFSTFNHGVFVLPKNAATIYSKSKENKFNSDNFMSVTKLTNGKLMTGDDAGNLYQLNGKTWDINSLHGSKYYNRILQIVPLPEANWLAVTDKGVYSSKNGKTVVLGKIAAPKVVYKAKDGIWLGTSAYLNFIDDKTGENTQLRNTRTTAISSDRENNIWAGGLDGLYSQKDNFSKNWGQTFKPLGSRILDIKQAKDGSIWVVTPDYGLLNVVTRNGEISQVRVINDSLSTPIEGAQSVFLAKDSTLWLASNLGVYSIDIKGNINHYDKKNGLADNNVNAVFVEEDTLWIATTSGLSKLMLKQENELGNFTTRITGIQYMNGAKKSQFDLAPETPNRRTITIPANATMLELDVAALYYRTRGNINFEYTTKEQLLPLQYLTFQNLFSFLTSKVETDIIDKPVRNFGINIYPSCYFITVVAILPSGTRGTIPDQITIVVLPQWWQTIWVSLAVLLVIIWGIVRIFKARSAFLKLQGTASELQLQAIKSQMNPHFVGNSINAIQQFFYPPDPMKASEYISIFSDLLRRTMTFSEVDFIPFQEELLYVKDYLEMVKLRFGEQFHYEILGEQTIDPSLRFPAMLLQPILENATIHGLSPDKPSELTVKFEDNGQFLRCTLTDNGVGIDESLKRKNLQPNRRPSKGLQLLDQKVQMLNKIHDVKLKVVTTDMSKANPKTNGTEVVISFLRKTTNPVSKN